MCEICKDFACTNPMSHMTADSVPDAYDWGVAEPTSGMDLSKCLTSLTTQGWEVVSLYGGMKQSQVAMGPEFCHVVVVRRLQSMREAVVPNKVTL